MQDLLLEYMDDCIYEFEMYDLMINEKSEESFKSKAVKKEQERMLDKFLPIIQEKDYKYYCIIHFWNPVKSAAITGTASGAGVALTTVSPTLGLAAATGIGVGAHIYNQNRHYTLYGSNEKPFSKSMLNTKPSTTNPWKKVMRAKELKIVTTNSIRTKSQIPSQLQKYVIE